MLMIQSLQLQTPPVTVLCTQTRTQHLPAPLLDPQNKTFRSSWVAMPMQEHRGHFFPIYSFPKQVSLEGWRIPPFMESLPGARHCAKHFIHWLDQYGTEHRCSGIPSVLLCLLGTQLNAISLSVGCRWKWYMSFPHLAHRNPTHSVFHFLFLICQIEGDTLNDLKRFGLKGMEPVPAWVFEWYRHIKLWHGY